MERPTSITVFGVLNIVFGALGVLGTCFSILDFFLPLVPMPPIIEEPGPVLRAYSLGSSVLHFIASIVLVVAGIGLLKLRPWARIMSIGYGIYDIVSCLINMVVGPIMMSRMVVEMGESEVVVAVVIAGILGPCVGLIYPILLIIFMCREAAVTAFRQTQQVAETPETV